MKRSASLHFITVIGALAATLGGGAFVPSAGAAPTLTEVQVTGRAGVPADATAVVVNLTATNAGQPGYATAYPCGSNVPANSTINYYPGQTIANSTIVDIGAGGRVCVYALNSVDLIVDVQGWFPANAAYTAIAPQRITDTRGGSRPNNSAMEVQITGRAGVPADATAVAVNLTATNAGAPGYAAAYPCGGAVPTISTVNYAPGQAIANSTIVDIGANGRICLYALNAVDLIVDVQGWFPANATYTATAPVRLLDTRATGGRLDNSAAEVQITGRAGIPSNAAAVTVNLTATNAAQPGYAAAYPCGGTVPTVSTVNYAPGQAIANSTIVDIGANGRICLYALNAVDLIVDVQGWFPANATYTAINPQRITDTRIGLGGNPAPAPGQEPPPDAPIPPAGAAFAEYFTGNAGLSRFDTGVFHRDNVMITQTQWSADHDLNCGDPTTQRTVHRHAPAETFFTCRDHLMTSVGDTSGYSIAWFSPKQTFRGGTHTKVSFEVNVTDLGARQWWEVSLVPVGTPFLATESSLASVANISSYDRNAVVVGSGPLGNDGNIVSGGQGHDPLGYAHICGVAAVDPEGCASKAIRRPFTITDNRNGTITFSYLGQTYTYAGSFPPQFRVYFKDHNYTPDKDGTPVGHTWHWDSIVVQ